MANSTTRHDADSHSDSELSIPWIKVLGLLLLGLALMGIYGWRQFDGVIEPETMEMASLARNMAQGRGFVASCVRPADVWFMAAHSEKPVTVEHMPDLRHGPVFPSLLAAGYFFTGLDEELPMVDFTRRAECFVILPLTIFFTLLSGLLIFFITRRLVGESPALLVLALFVLSLPVIQLGLWGGASALLLFLSTAALWAVLRCVSQRDGLHGDETVGWLAPLLLAGFLAGLAMLTRYGSWVLGLVLLIYLFHGHDRRRCWVSCGVFLATLMIVLTPWVTRNVVVTGAPFGMAPYLALNDSALFDGDGFDASLHPVLGNLAVTRAMKSKLIANGLGMLQGNFASLGAGVLLVLFGASLFVRFENERLIALRHATLGGVLAVLATAALSGVGASVAMTDLLPCIFVLATVGFFGLIHNIDFQEPERETLAILALLLWAAAPTALALFAAGTHRAYPPYHPPFIRHMSGLLARSETLCTDIPWATAWYGGRTSILLPRNVHTLMELKENVPGIAAVYLTSETARQVNANPKSIHARASWRPLLSGRIPPGFPFTEAITFPASSRNQWFFTDRQHLSSH